MSCPKHGLSDIIEERAEES